ncbi:MAG: NAD(P)/FAD-dependent oxidoreductase [Clostridia bacterium]|nr:NAD(P)/FAD-dependent oxidoreductase [Clostridia bacterium]
MILLNDVSCPLDTDFENLLPIVSKELKINESDIISVSLFRKSVDARKKESVHFCCSFLVQAKGEAKILKRIKKAKPYKEQKYIFKTLKNKTESRPVIAGFGPAGMFAALTLARAGMKPVVLERGSDVDTRTAAVTKFFSSGKLETENNVQFGEGGAGTFSDGKLNTGINDYRCREILKIFSQKGADKKILTDAKPHVGTDVLKTVVKQIRQEIISLGGEVRFNCRVDGLEIKDEKITAVYAGKEIIKCEDFILAIGHSARDTFKMLKEKGITMVRKPFSAGVRIEHLQSDINSALYGEFANHPALGAADYKLSAHLENGRGVYTFCMCPGGEVINASSEISGTAVNGMSYSSRAGKNSNSAVIVNVNPQDIEGEDVLGGAQFQRQIEQKAYNISGGFVPVQTVGSFLEDKENKAGKVLPTVKPKAVFCNLKEIFPEFISRSIEEGLKIFGRKISGFDSPDAILTAPETRSSSPVKILRDETFQSLSLKGLYPCGEGAGYAGGIMSAAADGMRVAEAVIEKYNN